MMKVKVRSLDGDTHCFGIVAGVLQGDTSTPYLLIICQDYVFKRLWIKWKAKGSSWQRKEAEDTQQKQLWTRTTPMT